MPRSNAIYWGEGGQIGPFDVQEDGWPHAGQVMRYFREKLDITAKTFGKLYGKEVRENGKPICERWILEMELENKVPTDITRRRIIAHLLSIPPVLLGLASLEDVLIQQEQEQPSPPTTVHQSTLQKVPIEIATYEKNVRIALQLHRTSNAQALLQEVNSAIKDLENFEGQTKGNLLYRVRELLISNRFLAAKIVKDQRQYALAYMYANNAVYVAKSMEDDELLAAAKYIRGCTKLEWGLFGVMKRGRFQEEVDRYKNKLLPREYAHSPSVGKENITMSTTTFFIGVSGHQNLGDEVTQRFVVHQFREALRTYQQREHNETLYSALAKGADQMFVQIALELGVAVEIVLPCAEYETLFPSEEEREVYRQLLHSHQALHRLPFRDCSEDAFLAAGQWKSRGCAT
jgi:hypothetical protein